MSSDGLSKTVLNEWHRQHGAKMVDFGGWDMPVQYKTGIIQEHLNTRRKASLFDISHMSRFEINGEGALKFLQYMLTNNAAVLDVGDAQYTFLSDPNGIIIDDAFLYKTGDINYILVTNAGKREDNWQWLKNYMNGFSDFSIEDKTDELGMIALQGPISSSIIAEILGKKALPESKRNKLRISDLKGHKIMLSNTGYTGEAKGLEIITHRVNIIPLWDQILRYGESHGVYPAGLGARDSARIEAGLPLGGHEFPIDPSGEKMPLFALGKLARVGVSFESTKGYFSGKDALYAQYRESVKFLRGELRDVPLEDRLLKRVIRPIAAIEGTRPLREKSGVYSNENHVGWVSSGSVVPYTHFYGKGVTAVPHDSRGLRSIGLAYIDSNIRISNTNPIVLEVKTTSGSRKTSINVRLVQSHMASLPPYSRPLTEIPAPKRTPMADEVTPNDLEGIAESFVNEVAEIAIARQQQKILLTPSVLTMTPLSRFISIVFAGDYAEHTELIPGHGEELFYSDVKHHLKYEDMVASQYARYFNVPFVEIRPISGQMANTIVFEAIRNYKNRFRKGVEREGIRAIVKYLLYGGHLSSQPSGALNPSVGFDEETGRLATRSFPVLKDNLYHIDVQRTLELVEQFHPDVLVFGGSMIIGPEPIREIANAIHNTYGKDNPNRPILMYDAAHVAGLFGHYFQNPFEEGIDIVTASTHKTIYSQQRGVILSNIDSDCELYMLWDPHIRRRTFPGNLSSHHPGTLVASYLDIVEMNAFKEDYQKQIFENTRAFATALRSQGIDVERFCSDYYSNTHQVLLNVGHARGNETSKLLQACFINANSQALPYDSSFTEASGIRTGTNEMTKRGFKEPDFEQTAEFIGDAYIKRMDSRIVRDKVIEFRAQDRFRGWEFCLPMEKARPLALKMAEAVWGGPLYQRYYP